MHSERAHTDGVEVYSEVCALFARRKKHRLINSHIDFETHNLAQSILGELVLANL